jgi:hypothetical protein
MYICIFDMPYLSLRVRTVIEKTGYKTPPHHALLLGPGHGARLDLIPPTDCFYPIMHASAAKASLYRRPAAICLNM